MSQSDSFKVKLGKYYLAQLIGEATGGFVYATLSYRSPQMAMIGAIIGGLSFSSAKIVSLLGNTWWQKGLLWVTTMGIIISCLIHLLVPSANYSLLLNLVSFLPSGLLYYYLNRRFSDL